MTKNLIYRMTSPLCLPYTIFLIVMGTVLYYKVLPIITRMLACGVAVRVSIVNVYVYVCVQYSSCPLYNSFLCSATLALTTHTNLLTQSGYAAQRCRSSGWARG